MSRVAKNPITIPDTASVTVDNNIVKVKGTKGELEFNMHSLVSLEINENVITVNYDEENQQSIALAGTTRSIVNNMVVGVTDGFKKYLTILGVGYQAKIQGKRLQLQLGFSHDIIFELPEDIEIKVDRSELTIEGIDKQLVGSVAAKIRSFRKPEPYKGKGIRYKDEFVISKQGKTVGSK